MSDNWEGEEVAANHCLSCEVELGTPANCAGPDYRCFGECPVRSMGGGDIARHKEVCQVCHRCGGMRSTKDEEDMSDAISRSVQALRNNGEDELADELAPYMNVAIDDA